MQINHVGFHPDAAKTLVVPQPASRDFVVHKLHDIVLTPAFSGTLRASESELENAMVGDFSGLREEGIYRIQCGEEISRCFIISRDVLRQPASVLLNFFRSQRCGDSGTGWASPCHVDDGIVLSTGERRNLSGGYHQSSDCRKWPWGISLALVGMAEAALTTRCTKNYGEILAEIRWGGDYLRKLQREDGGFLDSVFVPEGYEDRKPGDVRGYGDQGAAWRKRKFYQSDAPAPAQWNGIRFLALESLIFQKEDPVHAKLCLDAALSGWVYMGRTDRDFSLYRPPQRPPLGHDGMEIIFAGFYKDSALEHAHRLCSALALHRAGAEGDFLEAATRSASALTELQLGGDSPLTSACFKESSESPVLANSYFYFWNTSAPIGLADMVTLTPQHPDSGQWRKAVRSIAEQFLAVAWQNPFWRTARLHPQPEAGCSRSLPSR